MSLPRTRRPTAPRWAAALLGTTILAGFAVPAQAQDLHWNGSVSHDLDDPANWDEGQTPTPDTTIVINNQTNAQAANAPSLDHDLPIYRTEVGTADGISSLYYISSSQFFSGDPNDGRANDLIGANGGQGGVHVVGGAWRSLGMDLGFGTGSQGLVAVEQGGRLESGDVALGLGGGNGWLSLNLGATLLGGNISVGDANGGHGQFDMTVSTAQIDDLTVTNGVVELLGSGVTAQDVRLNAPKFTTEAKITANGSGLDATRLLIGGEAASGGNPVAIGRGSMEFDNGALTTHSASVIGYGAGSSGSLALEDSNWTMGGNATFGVAGGHGDFHMTGGHLQSTDAILAGMDAGSSGTLFVSQSAFVETSGLGLGLNGGNGSLSADLVATIDASQGIQVGYSADGFPASTGSIDLHGGAHLITGNGDSIIGAGAGSTGIVSLDGTFTQFDASQVVRLGYQGGTGNLNLTDHAAFSSTAAIEAGVNAGSTGGIAAAGGSTVDLYELTMGINGGAGSLDVDGSAITVTHNSFFGANAAGEPGGRGDIALRNGGTFVTQPGGTTIAGQGVGSISLITIDGAGSMLATPDFRLGTEGGRARTDLTGGATLNATDLLYLGSGSGSLGRVTADGSSVNTGAVVAGVDGGTAQIFLTNQSQLATRDMILGTGAGGEAHLMLDESAWFHQGAIDIGQAGSSGLVDLLAATTATIDLQGGAMTLGEGGTGVIHVDGIGTTLAVVGGSFVMGSDGGDGGLTARNGGSFTRDRGIATGIGAGSQGVLGAVGAGSSITMAGPVLFGSDGGSGFIVASGGATVDIGSNISTHIFGEGPGSLGGVDVDTGATVLLRGSVDFGGDVAGGHAVADIDGAGSQFGTVDGVFNMTAGDIAVTDGGRLFTGGGANVGGLGDAMSTITVSGAGSHWDPASDTYIGGRFNGDGNPATAGRGMVSILDGGDLGGGNARIHLASQGGTGTLAIDMDSTAGAGEYEQGAGGTLMIGVDPTTNGHAGRLTTDGAISFADGSHITFVKQVDGRYHIGDRYLIIRSINEPIVDGGIVFDGLEQQSLFVGLVPVFEALGQGEALYLDVAQTRSFASVAGTPNQAAAGGAADGLGNANPVKAAILDLMTGDEARGAFDLLSGEIHPSIRTALIEDARLPRMAVLNRLGEAEGGSGAWVQGVGNWGSSGGDGNAATLDRNTKGVLIGADLALGGSGLRLGVAGGYADGDLTLDARGSRAGLKTTHALAYLGGGWGPLRLRLGAGYGWTRADTSRSVAFPGFSDNPHARYDARTFQGFGEIGYRVPVATGWIEPFAGVTTIRVTTDGFGETGGPAALTVDRAKQTDSFSSLGIKGTTAIAGPLTAGFSLAWEHRFGSDRTPGATMRFAGAAPFAIDGVPLDEDSAQAELSLGWRVTPGAMLSARYSGAIGARRGDNAVKLGLSIGF